MIFISIRSFIPKFGVNFRFLEKNGDIWAKKELYKLQGKSYKAQERTKVQKANSAIEQLAQASLERECSSGSVKNRHLSHSNELYLA